MLSIVNFELEWSVVGTKKKNQNNCEKYMVSEKAATMAQWKLELILFCTLWSMCVKEFAGCVHRTCNTCALLGVCACGCGWLCWYNIITIAHTFKFKYDFWGNANARRPINTCSHTLAGETGLQQCEVWRAPSQQNSANPEQTNDGWMKWRNFLFRMWISMCQKQMPKTKKYCLDSSHSMTMSK